MTALRLNNAPAPKPDVRNPRVFKSQVDLANMIARFIAAMPLEEAVRISTDAAELALLKDVSDEVLERIQRDRDVLVVLWDTQLHLAKVGA